MYSRIMEYLPVWMHGHTCPCKNEIPVWVYAVSAAIGFVAHYAIIELWFFVKLLVTKLKILARKVLRGGNLGTAEAIKVRAPPRTMALPPPPSLPYTLPATLQLKLVFPRAGLPPVRSVEEVDEEILENYAMALSLGFE